VPQGPLIVIANEFIDALPARQMVRQDGTWRERCVTVGPSGTFAFCAGEPVDSDALPSPARVMDASDGAIIETRPAATSLLSVLAARAKEAPIAVLIADYGHEETGFGDTLQAVHRHRFADPLAGPGDVDLTAHVDFAALRRDRKHPWAHRLGPCRRSSRSGPRCDRLLRTATEDQKAAILSGAARLADPRQMGLR
jgi:NADH dehydrogenase [ubiquinone] 1 alpha subcomplex assembly factor 7